MGSIVFEGVTKRYPNGYVGVDHMDLTIEDGEFLVLVGPSGCGKSTALRMVAGLEAISEGTLRIGDRVVNSVSPQDRDIAMVFQNYALFPQMTVAENIGFAMRLRKESKDAIRRKVEEVASILDLTEYLDRRPGQLSGGQRQRVAMGRAIVRSPQVFLMDEPLSNLDAKLRVQMRSEIARLQRQLGVTTIYVTHDQVEAMTMGDRVAVLKRGVLQQVDAPQDLYDRPSSLFIAQFIGSPPMNIVKAGLERRGDDLWVALGGGRALKLDRSVLAAKPALAGYVGGEVALGMRAEDIKDAAFEPGSDPDSRLDVVIDLVEALGSEQIVYFGLDTQSVRQEASGDDTAPIGDKAVVCGRLDPRSRPRLDQAMTLAVDTTRVHFFDLATGLAIRD